MRNWSLMVGAVLVETMVRLFASPPGTIDRSFQAGMPGNSIIQGAEAAGDRILVSDGQTLTRLMPNGAEDPGFRKFKAAGSIARFEQDGNGFIYLLGVFPRIDSESRTNLGRLKPDGTMDDSYLPMFPDGVGSTVGMTVQPDGQAVLIFSKARGDFQLRRFRANGTLDVDFMVSDRAGFAFAGKGGTTYAIGTYPLLAPVVSRFSGTNITTTAMPQPPGFVTALAQGPDGSFVLRGSFAALTTISFSRMERFLPNGSFDAQFHARPAQENRPTSELDTALCIDSQGRILLPVTRINGVGVTGLVRLNPDGSLDESFQTPPITSVKGVWLLPGDDLLVATIPSGTQTNSLVKIFGSYSTNEPPRITKPPRSLARFAGENAWFEVKALGHPLSFEWRKDGKPLTGETRSTLSLTNLNQQSAGNYTVVVSNSLGAVESESAMLAVEPEPPGNLVPNWSFETSLNPEPSAILQPYKGLFCPPWNASANAAAHFRAPEQAPRNLAGDQTALHGVSYVAMKGSNYFSMARLTLTVPFSQPLQPNQPYEISIGLSLGDNAEAAAMTLPISVYTPGKSAAAVGIAKVSDRHGWERFRASFIPTEAYTHLLIDCLPPANTTDESWVFIDSVRVLPAAKVSPTLRMLPDKAIALGTELLITNEVLNSPLPGGWMFELGPSSPPDARIDPTTGVIRWKSRVSGAWHEAFHFSVEARNPAMQGTVLSNAMRVMVLPVLLELDAASTIANSRLQFPVRVGALVNALPSDVEVNFQVGFNPAILRYQGYAGGSNLFQKFDKATINETSPGLLQAKVSYRNILVPSTGNPVFLIFDRINPNDSFRGEVEWKAQSISVTIPDDPLLQSSFANTVILEGAGAREFQVLGNNARLEIRPRAAGGYELTSLGQTGIVWQLQWADRPGLPGAWKTLHPFGQTVPLQTITNAIPAAGAGYFRLMRP